MQFGYFILYFWCAVRPRDIDRDRAHHFQLESTKNGE